MHFFKFHIWLPIFQDLGMSNDWREGGGCIIIRRLFSWNGLFWWLRVPLLWFVVVGDEKIKEPTVFPTRPWISVKHFWNHFNSDNHWKRAPLPASPTLMVEVAKKILDAPDSADPKALKNLLKSSDTLMTNHSFSVVHCKFCVFEAKPFRISNSERFPLRLHWQHEKWTQVHPNGSFFLPQRQLMAALEDFQRSGPSQEHAAMSLTKVF